MRYSSEQVAASRDALVRTAARIFREKGFAGVGVDDLSRQAGVTSGSFYKHFASKSDAFLEVVRAGVDRVAKRVRSLKASKSGGPGGWVNDFATIHSSKEHLRSVGLGCNLPTLSVEVARSDSEARKAFEESIRKAIREMASGEPFSGTKDAEERSVAILSILTGAMVIARAMANPKTAQMITESARRAALLIADKPLPDVPRSDIKWTPADY
jgi:TetR/AcrR family transcriptional repressor of nem operon